MKGLMMDDYPLTLTAFLLRAERYFPEVPIASRNPDRSVAHTTYGAVARRARALAAAIRAGGLGPGDRVGTLMWNHATHLEAYLGIPAAGTVLHTLNLRLPAEQLSYVVNHGKDRWLIVDDVLWPLFEKIREQIHPERVLVVPFSGKELPPGVENYETVVAASPPTNELPTLGEGDAAGLCYTSGTTGNLKGVLYSHRSLVLHSLVAGLTAPLSISDRVLVVVPMFHANAWGLPFALTMLGAQQIFPGPHHDPESLVDLMEQERATVAAGVPSIWFGILETLEKNPGRWKLSPNLRMLIGGSAVPEAMIRRFDQLGIRVMQGYGMTETSPIVTLATPKPAMQEWAPDRLFPLLARQGLPLPFVDVRIRNQEREVAWDGKSSGELEVRAPWAASSYFGETDVRGKWTDDGWLRTGDVATIDPDGYVEVVDRLKDLVKSGGEWISSVAVENALIGHPAVREAAVIAVPDAKWGERPRAVVVLRDGAAASADDLRAFLAPRFPKWWLPDEFRFVASLPKTSTGKVSKLTLRRESIGAPPASDVPSRST